MSCPVRQERDGVIEKRSVVFAPFTAVNISIHTEEMEKEEAVGQEEGYVRTALICSLQLGAHKLKARQLIRHAFHWDGVRGIQKSVAGIERASCFTFQAVTFLRSDPIKAMESYKPPSPL